MYRCLRLCSPLFTLPVPCYTILPSSVFLCIKSLEFRRRALQVCQTRLEPLRLREPRSPWPQRAPCAAPGFNGARGAAVPRAELRGAVARPARAEQRREPSGTGTALGAAGERARPRCTGVSRSPPSAGLRRTPPRQPPWLGGRSPAPLLPPAARVPADLVFQMPRSPSVLIFVRGNAAHPCLRCAPSAAATSSLFSLRSFL